MTDDADGQTIEYRFSLGGDEIDLSLLELCFSDKECCVSKRVLEDGSSEWILSAIPLFQRPARFSYRPAKSLRTKKRFKTQFDDNIAEVQALADQLISCMDGAAKLLRPNFRSIGIAAIYSYGTDGRWLGTSVSGSSGRRFYSLPGKKGGLPDLVRRWTECGMEDPSVSDALHIYGSGAITWSSLYLVYEIIRDDCGGNFKDIVSRKDLGDFCSSANNNRTFSEGSRHAEKIRNPRAKARTALSVQEANSIVRQMLNAWLGDKIGYWMK